MQPAGSRRPVDFGDVAHPTARGRAPALVSLVEADAAIHGDLVRRAHERLGSPGVAPLDPWKELSRAARLERAIAPANPMPFLGPEASKLVRENRHAIRVPLGTPVVLPERPLDADRWTVVGVGGSDRIHLERVLPDGASQRQVRRWPALVLANPALAEHHVVAGARDDLLPRRLREVVPRATAPTAVVDAFEAAREMTPPAARRYELVSTMQVDGEPIVVRRGTWQELAGQLKLARLRPLPAHPSDAALAASLVHAADPPLSRAVIAAEAQQLIGTRLLVGADRLAAGHRATNDALELERLSRWYQRLGLRSWRDPGDSLVLTTGSFDSIGNASAHGSAEYAIVTTGPREHRSRSSLLNMLPHRQRAALRSGDETLRANWRAVLGHEVGHVATQQAWGLDVTMRQHAAREAGDTATFARLAQHKVAEEAFSDLFGASYARTRDIGVRDLGRLRNGIGDLDQLRATIVQRGFHHTGHTGTQLITSPMLEVQQRHGWNGVAEVTAGAAKRLGAMMGRGEIEAIDVPSAARALRDSAAMRWGADDEAVRAMVRAWQKLRVVL